MNEETIERVLNYWWNEDRRDYLTFWYPDIYESELAKLMLDNRPQMFADALSLTPIELSKSYGIGVPEILQSGILYKRKHIICPACRLLIGYAEKLAGRVCPSCRVGILKEITREELKPEGKYHEVLKKVGKD